MLHPLDDVLEPPDEPDELDVLHPLDDVLEPPDEPDELDDQVLIVLHTQLEPFQPKALFDPLHVTVGDVLIVLHTQLVPFQVKALFHPLHVIGDVKQFVPLELQNLFADIFWDANILPATCNLFVGFDTPIHTLPLGIISLSAFPLSAISTLSFPLP